MLCGTTRGSKTELFIWASPQVHLVISLSCPSRAHLGRFLTYSATAAVFLLITWAYESYWATLIALILFKNRVKFLAFLCFSFPPVCDSPPQVLYLYSTYSEGRNSIRFSGAPSRRPAAIAQVAVPIWFPRGMHSGPGSQSHSTNIAGHTDRSNTSLLSMSVMKTNDVWETSYQ